MASRVKLTFAKAALAKDAILAKVALGDLTPLEIFPLLETLEIWTVEKVGKRVHCQSVFD